MMRFIDDNKDNDDKYQITIEKLNRADCFRVQIILKGDDKLLYAILSTFFDKYYKGMGRQIRDRHVKPFIDRLEEDFKVLKKGNPHRVNQQIIEHINQCIPDENLRQKAYVNIFQARLNK